MKSILALLPAFILFGCQAPRGRYGTEFEDTRKVGSSEVLKLPRKLQYGQLLELWGPAVMADPFYLYQSKIDGIVLAVFIGNQGTDPFSTYNPLEEEVIGMYFMDMTTGFRIHAWGRDVIQELNDFHSTK